MKTTRRPGFVSARRGSRKLISGGFVAVLLAVGLASAWAQAPQEKLTDSKEKPVAQELATDSKEKPVAQRPAAGTDNNEGVREVTQTRIASLRFGAASDWTQTPQQKAADTTAKPAGQQPAADDAAELSKKLSNPVASLISFPVQQNYDFNMGPGNDGWKLTINVQPVIPIALNEKWNLISRTIIPIIHQSGVTAPGVSQSGLGDIVQSLFFSPNKSEPFIWGVGPAILIPTATDKFLGSKQLGLGPTFVILKQQSGWTVGALYNHIWRVAGGSGRPRVNSDFIQPFLTYGTKTGWTYSLNTESSYDWTNKNWAVPIHFQITKIVRFGKQPMSLGGGVRCWATSPSGGPQGCGLRIVVTALFPKK